MELAKDVRNASGDASQGMAPTPARRRAPITLSGGTTWPRKQIIAIYELWFSLFLVDRARQGLSEYARGADHLSAASSVVDVVALALRDVLLSLRQIKSLLVMGIYPVPSLLHILCVFCLRNDLHGAFQLLYRLHAALFAGSAKVESFPPVDFYYDCMLACRAADQDRAATVVVSSNPSPAVSRSLPAAVSVSAKCTHCSFESTAETLLSRLQVSKLPYSPFSSQSLEASLGPASTAASIDDTSPLFLHRSALLQLLNHLYAKPPVSRAPHSTSAPPVGSPAVSASSNPSPSRISSASTSQQPSATLSSTSSPLSTPVPSSQFKRPATQVRIRVMLHEVSGTRI